jgi:hypothetical protein
MLSMEGPFCGIWQGYGQDDREGKGVLDEVLERVRGEAREAVTRKGRNVMPILSRCSILLHRRKALYQEDET